MGTYNELYSEYKGHVVLIRKQYMYVAYNESARVLSYLLDYKLYETNEGLTACGPDKDKIIYFMNKYHVNYVISEFGKITDYQSFSDNTFYDCLNCSSDFIKEHTEIAHEPVPVKTQESIMAVPSWLTEGLIVSHKSFGLGKVKTIKPAAGKITLLLIMVLTGGSPIPLHLRMDSFQESKCRQGLPVSFHCCISYT